MVNLKDIKICTIGGGTGNSTILKGLKKYTKNITAIVTVADDGGSSGMLREDLKIIPPGDIRACLISLANTEKSMEKLMKYRFKEGNLKGQSFGNLFLVAMADIYKDFVNGIKETSNILAITGKVLPVSLDNITLFAELEDKTIIEGESNIALLNKNNKKIKRVFVSPEYVEPLDEVVYEILNSDIIVLGPGSLYTSIIPNLLISNIAFALKKTKAKIYYVLNIMTEPAETYNYSVLEHIQAILNHCNGLKIDTIVVNNEKISSNLEQRYNKFNSRQILLTNYEKNYIKDMKVNIIEENLLKKSSYYVKHNENNLAKVIYDDYIKYINVVD